MRQDGILTQNRVHCYHDLSLIQLRCVNFIGVLYLMYTEYKADDYNA